MRVSVELGDRWIDVLGQLRAGLAARYGKPGSSTVRVPQSCSKNIAECVKSERAEVRYAWAWADGHAIDVRVTDHIEVSYDAPNARKALASHGQGLDRAGL